MIFAHDYHILEALSENGALPTGDVAFLVNGCRDRSGSATMSRALKSLKAKGLVKPLDCDTPVVWLRTEAGSKALKRRNEIKVHEVSPPAQAMEARRAGTQGGPVHDSAVREAKAPDDTPPLAEGDAHPLPDPFAGITTDPALLEALKRAAKREMTPAEHHAQRRSWIIGEMGIEHPELSREQLEALADRAVGPAPASRTGSEVKED